VPNPPLDVSDDVSGIGLVPAPIEVLRGDPELDDKAAGEVLRLGLAALLAPEAEEGGLVGAHDGPGVRAADEGAAARVVLYVGSQLRCLRHKYAPWSYRY
jgi:hypothetical protein